MRLSLLFSCLVTTQLLLAQTFTEVPPASDFVGVNLGSVAFSDVDGDGDEDALITGLDSSREPSTKLYSNDGSGNFSEILGTPFDRVYNGAVAFSDVDGDGDYDILITGDNGSERIAKLYTNDGTGSFVEVMGTPFAGVTAGSVAFADVDDDGDYDVLITGISNALNRTAKLYTNDGTGTFFEVLETPFVGVFDSAIGFSDVDGDGDNDMLITGNISGLQGTAKLYSNDGAGGFTEVESMPFAGVYNGAIAFADVDNDGDSDVLISGENDTAAATKLYTNDGTGTFSEVLDTPFPNVYESSVGFADVDGDGDSDVLITGDDNSARIALLYSNDGMGNFTEALDTNFDGVSTGTSVAFSDVDGDDDIDILITGRNNSFERIAKLYLNDGMGGYPVILPPPFIAVKGSSIAFSDVDGDDDSDVLITGFNDPGFRTSKLYTNDGTGTFTELTNTPFVAIGSGSIAFSDVDGDGDSDVLITGESNTGRTAALYTNDGAGTFTEVMDTPFTPVAASFVAFSDIDGDGDNDVLLAGTPNPGPDIVKLYTNNGTGNFTEVTDTPFSGIKVRSFAFSDVDGDGDSDLLMIGRENVAPPFTAFARLYRNDGTGGFSEVPGTPFAAVNSSSLAFADVDGDGDNDVLISGSFVPDQHIAKLYTNDGTGSFTEDLDTPFEGVNYSAIAFSDVDNDGDNDVLITGQNATLEHISKLYVNDGTGSFFEVLDTPFAGVAGGTGATAFADIDNDGDHDLLITGQDNDNGATARLYTNDGTTTSTVVVPTRYDIDFVVYPNPVAEHQLNIRYQSGENGLVTIKMYDLHGRLLKWWQRRATVGQQLYAMDITGLVQGVYLLELDHGGKRGTSKVIVE